MLQNSSTKIARHLSPEKEGTAKEGRECLYITNQAHALLDYLIRTLWNAYSATDLDKSIQLTRMKEY